MKLRWLLALALVAACTSAHARTKIIDIENSPVPQGMSMEQVQQGIVSGSMDRRWVARVIAPGHIEAQISVRSHIATVDIKFSESSYSIVYKDSRNLDYRDGNIHRNYNKWVANLNHAVQTSLVRVATAGMAPSSTASSAAASSAAASSGAASSAAVSSEASTTPNLQHSLSMGTYNGEVVTIPTTVAFVDSLMVPAVVSECRIGEQLADFMQAQSHLIQQGEVPSGGHYIDMSITELHMPRGGAWSGPKWLEVTGTLHEGDGDPVASFRAKRFSTGGAFAVFKGNCRIVERCSKAIAQDVAAWLREPVDGAELGDAR